MYQLDYLGHGLFGLLANRFDHLFYDGGLLSIADLEAAVRDEPAVAARHFALGRRYLQDAKPAMARKAFQNALQLDPREALSRVGLSCALVGMRRTSDAIDELHHCLDDHSDNEPALLALSFCTQKPAMHDFVTGVSTQFDLVGVN